jgi:hypothetical protein
MRRRLFLGTLLTTAAGATTEAWAADAFPYGDSHVFTAHRNGQMIGHHALRFRNESGQRHVATSTDLAVRLLGMNVYKFAYRCYETWSGDVFLGLTSETNDDSKKYLVRANHAGDRLVVEREGAEPVFKASSGNTPAPKDASGRDILPAHTLPSTHWNILQVQQNELLHTEYGMLYKVAVTKGARETIRTATSALPATRYDYTGDLQMTQWFDDRSRWVKSTFTVPDGSVIEYTLQE